jgi:hypothetical protein
MAVKTIIRKRNFFRQENSEGARRKRAVKIDAFVQISLSPEVRRYREKGQ